MPSIKDTGRKRERGLHFTEKKETSGAVEEAAREIEPAPKAEVRETAKASAGRAPAPATVAKPADVVNDKAN